MSDQDLHHAAPAPTRAAASTVLQLGLLSIPVKIFTGEEKQATVTRSQFDGDDPVGSQPFNKNTGQPVQRDRIVYKATASDGTLVELTDDEKAQVIGDAAPVSDIVAFLPLDTIGTVYHVRQTDQIRPGVMEVKGKKVPNPGAAKALAALLAVMADRKVAALIKVGHNYGAVLPDGRYCKLAFAEQVRAELPMPEGEVSDRELAALGQLVDAIGTTTPVLADETSIALQQYVDQKAAGIQQPTVDQPAEVAPVVDLLAALEASLAAAWAA